MLLGLGLLVLTTLVGCGGASVDLGNGNGNGGGGGGGGKLTYNQVTDTAILLGAGVRYNDNGNGNPLRNYGAGGPWSWATQVDPISGDDLVAAGITLTDKKLIINNGSETKTLPLPCQLADTGWATPSAPTPYTYHVECKVSEGANSKTLVTASYEFTAGP